MFNSSTGFWTLTNKTLVAGQRYWPCEWNLLFLSLTMTVLKTKTNCSLRFRPSFMTKSLIVFWCHDLGSNTYCFRLLFNLSLAVFLVKIYWINNVGIPTNVYNISKQKNLISWGHYFHGLNSFTAKVRYARGLDKKIHRPMDPTFPK